MKNTQTEYFCEVQNKGHIILYEFLIIYTGTHEEWCDKCEIYTYKLSEHDCPGTEISVSVTEVISDNSDNDVFFIENKNGGMRQDTVSGYGF